MKNKYFAQIQELERLAKELEGVFSTAELETLFNVKSKSTFFSLIRTLQQLRVITKFKNGIYITKNFNPLLLSARIDPNSYISLGTVLSMNGLIGTVPTKQVSAVRVGRNRTYSVPVQIVKHYGISPDLYFGFTVKNGIKIADNEKAFIDSIYFQMKGAKFVFNPTSDIDLDRIDKKKVLTYLKSYKNERFVSYFRSIVNG